MIPQVLIPSLAKFSGSFWRTHLHADSKPLFWRLRELLSESAVFSKLHAAVAGLDGTQTVSGPKWAPYTPAECLMQGSGPERWVRFIKDSNWFAVRPEEDATIQTDFTPLAMMPGGHVVVPGIMAEQLGRDLRTWLVPIPEGLDPLVIAGKTWMVVGIDFIAYPGFIQVFRSPDDLFDPSGFVLLRYREVPRNTTRYAFHTEGFNSKLSARYFRENQSAEVFLAAACDAAGLVQVPQDCTILAATPFGYLTDAGPIAVPYEHTALETGSALLMGQFIGADPAVTDLHPDDFPNGFPLSTVTPWNLTIPPGVIRVDIVDGNSRPHLIGGDYELQRFWQMLATADAAHPEFSVAAALSLADGTHYINWLDLVTSQVLGRHAWLLKLNAAGTDQVIRDRVRRFLTTEKPLGKIVIVIDPVDLA